MHRLNYQPISFLLEVEHYMPQCLLDSPPFPITLQKRFDHCKATAERWDNLKDYYRQYLCTVPEPSTSEDTSGSIDALLRLTFKSIKKHLPMRIMS